MKPISCKEAQKGYAAAWSAWLLSQSEGQKKMYEDIMDQLAEHCVGPQEEWEEFIDSLPGFRDIYQKFEMKSDELFAELKRRLNG